MKKILACLIVCVLFTTFLAAAPTSPIRINQIGYELNGPKTAVFEASEKIVMPATFSILDYTTNMVVYTGDIVEAGTVAGWPGRYYWTLDFSSLRAEGSYKIKVGLDESFKFEIRKNILFKTTVSDLLHCFTQMRNTMEGDKDLALYGSTKRLNLYGGYNEASGDDSKHLTHLSYSNYMGPQEIPGFLWTMQRAYELNQNMFDGLNLKTQVYEEMAWGNDYLMRAQAEEGYFYITVWNRYNFYPRTVCAYEGKDLTHLQITDKYQSAMREGGGLSIASLAKAAALNVSGDYTPAQYLAAAEKAYAHIKANNVLYCDDGKENIIDDYTSLIAAVELYKATGKALYKTDAGLIADKLMGRLTPEGWFASDDAMNRPFFHAAEEGLPLIALAYYMEIDSSNDSQIKSALAKNLAWYQTITKEVTNPFDYVRQYHKPYKDGQYFAARTAFFISHRNETGYWWQGENARLGSMAAAILLAGEKLTSGFKLGDNDVSRLALSQLDWILGKNPFEVCMVYGHGTVNNAPYEGSTNVRGGICNGITAFENNTDEGVEFGPHPLDAWQNWRWLEQWMPHEFWYLFSISVVSKLVENDLSTPTPTADPTAVPTPTPYLMNIAKGKRVATSSIFGAAFSGTNANDGNYATAWGSETGAGPQWIYIDLGQRQVVNGIGLFWYEQYYARTFSCYKSDDGKNWQLLATLNKKSAGDDVFKENITLNCRYLAIYCSSLNSAAIGLKEFEIYQRIAVPTPSPTVLPSPTATPTPTATPDVMIKNSTFTTGIAHWNAYTDPAADASIGVYNGEIMVDITSGGTEGWHVTIGHPRLPIANNATYRVTFNARSASSRSIPVHISMPLAPYTTYYEYTANLTTTMQTYSFTFTMGHPTNNAAQLQFVCGAGNADVFIDNVYMEKIVR